MTNPIPLNGKLQITNTSDLYGNIRNTKNINLTKQGYIELAPRVAYLYSLLQDVSFGLPLSFGRRQNDQMYVATSIKSYIANTDIANFFIAQDAGTNAPTPTLQGFGLFWNNKWHVTDGVYIWVKNPSTGNWTQGGAPFVESYVGVCHMMEPFISHSTLCVADNNIVHQLDTSYSAASNVSLTIPSDYEITAISYNNLQMGIVTKLSNNAYWQNQESQFFVWDGNSAIAGEMYPVGSDTVICVIPYKSSWVLLTRRGRGIYFNGGGFDELFVLPFDADSKIWADPVTLKAFGKCLIVEDDKIYLNIPTMYNPFGVKGEVYMEQFPGGVLCYDPLIGLYNFLTPSNTRSSFIGVSGGNITLASGNFAVNSGQYLPATGNPIKYVDDPTSQIGGLTYNTVYYIIRINALNFKLALTKADAIAGTAITNLTSSGASNNHFLALEVNDYGVSLSKGNAGAIGLFGTNTVMHGHFEFGAEILDGASNTLFTGFFLTVPGFRNIGYFVTEKMTSQAVEDMLTKTFVKYQPLKIGDEIIVKAKSKDILGLPVSSVQYTGVTQWTGVRTLTTTANISEAYNYINDINQDADFGSGNKLECELVSGGGAGQTPQVTSIAYSAGIYTITLSEDIDGAAAGVYCEFVINNWHRVGRITSTNKKGWEDISVGKSSKWHELKVILIGDETTIETVQPVSSVHTPLVQPQTK